MSNDIPVSYSQEQAEDLLSKIRVHVSLPTGPERQENQRRLFPHLHSGYIPLNGSHQFRQDVLRTLHQLDDVQRIAEPLNGSVPESVHRFINAMRKRAYSALNIV